MTTLDQNQALLSLNQNLIPGETMIDGRSEREFLSFLSDYGALINFYDNSNTINGTWTPFLLKDPVFLLASISTTPFNNIHQLYLSCYKQLENSIIFRKEDFSEHLTQFMDQLFEVFIRIERWTWYMANASKDYSLKKYVQHQVNTNFAEIFWALLSFHSQMKMTFADMPYTSSDDYLLELSKVVFPNEDILVKTTNQLAFHEKIWWQNKDKSPYKDVLGFPKKPELSNSEIVAALKVKGDELFTFFKTTIDQSFVDFELLSNEKDSSPDTLLLRTFVNLLSAYQTQLNGLSENYLNFYYDDILQQTPSKAVADKVFLSTILAKDSAYTLPAGTLFDAGSDDNKVPITFASTSDVSLNPASIASAYTLMSSPSIGDLSSLSLTKIEDPGTLSLTEDGSIQTWSTFGSEGSGDSTEVTMGCAIASPLLYLLEGTRTITFSMTFVNDISSFDFLLVEYALSTETGWLSVTPDSITGDGDKGMTITFVLDPDQDAIVPFTEETDGYLADWPLFKMIFGLFPDLPNPPQLKTLTIDVGVTGMSTFQLYNDFGALSTKSAFQLFGPTPELDSNFIIGSAEIFSKPVTDLSIQLDWSPLPDNFVDYYQQYNYYWSLQTNPPTEDDPTLVSDPALVSTANEETTEVKEKDSSGLLGWLLNGIKKFFMGIYTVLKPIVMPFINIIVGLVKVIIGLVKGFAAILKKIVDWIIKIITSCPELVIGQTNEPFNNACFQVSFGILQEGNWNDFVLTATADEDTRRPLIGYNSNDVTPDNPYLFYQDKTDDSKKLSPYSKFVYPSVDPPKGDDNSDSVETVVLDGLPCDPYIQHESLEYTDSSSSGFMRMTLSSPSLGFGTSLYADVVTYYAMEKALYIAKKCPIPDSLNQAVNLPFPLKSQSLTATYSASQSYDFTKPQADNPIQYYTYSPFKNYLLYDSTSNSVTQFNRTITSIAHPKKVVYGVPLFPAFTYSGALILELENVVASNAVNFMFELSRTVNDTVPKDPVEYHYLSKTGWNKLDVLSDTTDNFTCSGIVTANIPDDIAIGQYTMDEENSWIAIGTNDDPASFAQTSYLAPNALLVQRNDMANYSSNVPPQIPADTISQPVESVPEIETIAQPFSSFGGSPRETSAQMNERVSTRLKSKDRVIDPEDYFRLIRENFDTICYSTTEFVRKDKTTYVYVARSYANANFPNAFVPLVSECTELKINEFLSDRASSFAKVKVKNFELEYVRVIATISVDTGYEFNGVKRDVIQSLNLYLSPWIASDSSQATIGDSITNSEVAQFIQTITGVDTVDAVDFQTFSSKDSTPQLCNDKTEEETTGTSTITLSGPSQLFASQMNHCIYPANE